MQSESGGRVKSHHADSESAAHYEVFMAELSPEEDARLKLDSYDADIRPLVAADRALLHELTVSVLWPHRALDLDMLLSLGKGYIAHDEIGRPLGSAMYFPAGDDFAMCGMMMTTPRLQTQGVGRRLLRRILADCKGRDLRLSATRSGYRLYRDAGFLTVGTIWQQQGIARLAHLPEAVPGLDVRPLAAADHGAVAALDTLAFGADRQSVKAAMLRESGGVVALRDGEVRGFALVRSFGKGVVIGPVVAEDDRMAMLLCAPLFQQYEGQFVRLDTPQQSENFKAFLFAAGLGGFDTCTEMRIGPQRRAKTGACLYGLAAHSLG
ncbi:GNAT family N-acetyltransferase [Sulfitobacter sp. EhC04]|uniref:GNAT family N-acetyltransferase n=1 Tax=Sulfitobacter sp. EhC04 TaxID=1849168 RepID=UPI0009EF3A5C|nr:GNAT family N-acetyltransferase [Sulfitobacter sp. EhC04]